MTPENKGPRHPIGIFLKCVRMTETKYALGCFDRVLTSVHNPVRSTTSHNVNCERLNDWRVEQEVGPRLAHNQSEK